MQRRFVPSVEGLEKLVPLDGNTDGTIDVAPIMPPSVPAPTPPPLAPTIGEQIGWWIDDQIYFAQDIWGLATGWVWDGSSLPPQDSVNTWYGPGGP